MNQLSLQTGAFTDQSADAIAQRISQASLGTTGKIFYCDAVNGDDESTGTAPQELSPGVGPVATLAAGYALLTEGANDVLVLIGNGLSSGSARISANFTWSKNAAHLVGICSPSLISQRARIAPPTGVATAFANFFTVSGSGCFFSNFELFQGFATGVAAEICLTVTGSRNVFSNVQVAGMGDTSASAGAASTTSRNLKISGGENLFVDCVIGLDTIARSVANASIEFAGGAARNIFRRCLLISQATIATAIGIYTAGAAAIDRFTLFDDCAFINAVNSGGTAMNALIQIAASSGGMIVLKNCMCVGITKTVDATSATQAWVYGPAANNAAYISDAPGS